MKAILPPVAIRWYLHIQAGQSIVWWIDPSICFCEPNQRCPFASLSGEIILYIFFQRYNCQGQCRELTCIWNIFIWPWVQNLCPNVGAHDQETPHVCWGKDHTKKWWTSPQSIIIISVIRFLSIIFQWTLYLKFHYRRNPVEYWWMVWKRWDEKGR